MANRPAPASAAPTTMTDIIMAKVNALVSEFREANGIANADTNALINAAAENDEGFAAVQELQQAYVNAWEALRNKVRDSVSIPSEQDQENAKKNVIEIKKKMRDLGGAIPTILEIPLENLDLPEEFTAALSRKNSGPTSTGEIRRPRIDGAFITDSEGNSIRSWEDNVTVTKVAEFLEVDNAVLMPHIPENLRKHEGNVEFHLSPDSGTYKGKQLFITLVPRR